MEEFKTKKGTSLPLMQLQGKDYLLVAHRIQWFREEHPLGRFESKCVESTAQYVIYHAEISIPGENGQYIKLADAVKREDYSHFKDAHEKAQTGAIGRALALVGYGTQFTASDLDEGTRLADAPVERSQTAQNAPGGAVRCSLCGTGLKLSKSGKSYYCPKFKDTMRGPHDIVDVPVQIKEPPMLVNIARLPEETHPEFTDEDMPF